MATRRKWFSLEKNRSIRLGSRQSRFAETGFPLPIGFRWDVRRAVGGWTELTVALRPECEERVDVDPSDDSEPLVLVIRSESADLARKAALFLNHSLAENSANKHLARTNSRHQFYGFATLFSDTGSPPL